MREINFRVLINGEWIYGGIIHWGGNPQIWTEDGHNYLIEDKETIGQFTGLKDKNEKEIYEGDILHLRCGCDDGVFNNSGIMGLVVFENLGFRVDIPDKKVVVRGGSRDGKTVSWREMHTWVGYHACLNEWQSKLEVVGNKFQNPELLNDANYTEGEKE